MEYYKLGDDGKFIEHVNDTYHGDYPLNAEIFRISPNGEYLLTSAGGAIYTANSSMTYLGALPRGSMRFSDFAFDETGTTIYAGMGTARKIQKFNYATLSIEEEFSTSGYPFIIFRRGEKIVVVSKTIPSTEYSSYYKIAIETVEI